MLTYDDFNLDQQFFGLPSLKELTMRLLGKKRVTNQNITKQIAYMVILKVTFEFINKKLLYRFSSFLRTQGYFRITTLSGR